MTLRASDGPVRALDRRRRLRKAVSLAGHSIMLLEDHADSRDLLVQALRNSGAAVAAFGAARDAFAALERVRPSVIVADIALPDEDGYSFIRRVRAHSTPAISGTGYCGHRVHNRSGSRGSPCRGISATLAKAHRSGRLVQAIYDLTHRST